MSWRPIYSPPPAVVQNAEHIKAIKRRNTDVSELFLKATGEDWIGESIVSRAQDKIRPHIEACVFELFRTHQALFLKNLTIANLESRLVRKLLILCMRYGLQSRLDWFDSRSRLQIQRDNSRSRGLFFCLAICVALAEGIFGETDIDGDIKLLSQPRRRGQYLLSLLFMHKPLDRQGSSSFALVLSILEGPCRPGPTAHSSIIVACRAQTVERTLLQEDLPTRKQGLATFFARGNEVMRKFDERASRR